MEFYIIHHQNWVISRIRAHLHTETFDEVDKHFSVHSYFDYDQVQDSIERKCRKDRISTQMSVEKLLASHNMNLPPTSPEWGWNNCGRALFRSTGKTRCIPLIAVAFVNKHELVGGVLRDNFDEFRPLFGISFESRPRKLYQKISGFDHKSW